SSYHGQDKDKMIAQINDRYHRQRFEFDASKPGILNKMALIPAAFRIGKNFKESVSLFLCFALPKLYRILHAVIHTFR
ncbi:hypothetical protein KA005_51500, partial [bacterium]|nr:hypothetical protein [bacterium]